MCRKREALMVFKIVSCFFIFFAVMFAANILNLMHQLKSKGEKKVSSIGVHFMLSKERKRVKLTLSTISLFC